MPADPESVLQEQIDYYRARAPEYDEWFERTGMYDLGPVTNDLWQRDVGSVVDALDTFAPTGNVLELACGTGWWTHELAHHASSLTCVDASPEVIERAKLRGPDARFVVADLFSWEPTERYDVVFFSFWISHVPADRFAAFWELVDRALTPGGRVFFLDNLRRPIAAVDGLAAFLQSDDRPEGIVTRKLNDGREFRAVKIYYEPDELTSRLADLGWGVQVHATEAFFYYGWGGKRG
jgi:demethylmenaquinone methyltransferase/2-methoxy-6-polyprenyl-1,4-benzoquinol methylase